MDNDGGRWVRIGLSLAGHPVWTELSPVVLKAAIACLLQAGAAPSKWRDGPTEIDVPRGSFVTSRFKLSKFCNLSDQQTRDSLTHLRDVGFLSYAATNRYTVITVCDYDAYGLGVAPEEPILTNEHALDSPNRRPNSLPNRRPNNFHSITDCKQMTLGNLEQELPPTTDPTTDPTTLASKKSASKTIKKCSAMHSETFAEFWQVVPRIARGAALKAWCRVVQDRAMAEHVIASARKQYPLLLEHANRHQHSVLHPATWLNQERYLDDPEAIKTDMESVKRVPVDLSQNVDYEEVTEDPYAKKSAVVDPFGTLAAKGAKR